MYRFTPHTITDELRLKEEFEQIRHQGHSADTEESTLEGCCFAAPVFGSNREVIAAVSVSLPKLRLKDKENRVIEGVKGVAHSISAELQNLRST